MVETKFTTALSIDKDVMGEINKISKKMKLKKSTIVNLILREKLFGEYFVTAYEQLNKGGKQNEKHK